MSKPLVAIIGRQNVGKSTLLNRVAGKPLAIVEDLPGTTRDRIFADVSWQDNEFILVDTGGLELDTDSTIGQGVKSQALAAITEADVVIFMVDIRNGVMAPDLEIADRIHKAGKPVILAANKADNNKLEAGLVDFYQLGLGEPQAISAHHGRGIADLLDRVVQLLPASLPIETESGAIKMALVGRPNVGKSMLLNAMLGEDRVIVDSTPGTTRDAVDTTLDFHGQNMVLIDTAGIRRRGRLGVGVEKYSVLRAMRAIERADVAALVVDATELITAQDMHIAGYIKQAAKGVLLVVNKWDMVDVKDISEYNRYIKSQLRFMAYTSVLYTSAKYKEGTDRILPEVCQIYQERQKRLSTSAVNDVIQEAVASHNIPRIGKKRLKVLYATQAEVNPPTFVFFVNDTRLIHFSYQRYLENKLREAFGFAGTPLRLILKTRGEA